MSELVKATGKIEIEATYDEGGMADNVKATWKGGDIVAFSQELLSDADPMWLQRQSDEIRCCQFQLRVIAENAHTVYAMRAMKMPAGYHRRIDGAMGTFSEKVACAVCGRKVHSTYGYEHNTGPDISVCSYCNDQALEKEP